MHTRTLVTAAAAAIGLVAVLRQRREAARVRAGDLQRLGPAATPRDRAPGTGLHEHVASWHPRPPRTPLGRAAVALWAAPLTGIGLAAALLGGARPHWDREVGAFVATSVDGPARWFLGQQGASAATLGQVVVARDGAPTRALLAHESLHARQQERLGLLFALAYPLAGARWGYRDNPFEVAARRVALLSDPPTPA